MKRQLTGVVTGLAVALLAAPARGQIGYEFADAAGTPQTSFTIAGPGGTVPVRIYLRETTAGAPVLSAAGGLGSAAVRLNFGGSGTVATVQTLATDITPGPAWAFGATGGSDLPLSAVLNDGSSITAGVAPDGAGRVLLGTFTLTGQSPGSAPLSAVDANPGADSDTTQFATGAGIDSLLAPASATVTVAPVPEPAGVLLACGMAVLIGRPARRRGQLLPVEAPGAFTAAVRVILGRAWGFKGVTDFKDFSHAKLVRRNQPWYSHPTVREFAVG